MQKESTAIGRLMMLPTAMMELWRYTEKPLVGGYTAKCLGNTIPGALVQVCGEAGVSVRPRTTSGRDAMLRAGAEAAVDAAMQQSGAQLAGMAPSTFVTGLARDLGQHLTLLAHRSRSAAWMRCASLRCSANDLCHEDGADIYVWC